MYPHSLLVSICQLGLVILVLFSYPLQLFPARASLDKVLFPPSADDELLGGGADDHATPDIPLGRFILESAFILVTTFTIAMFVSSLEVVLGFVGATGSTAISFILPAVFCELAAGLLMSTAREYLPLSAVQSSPCSRTRPPRATGGFAGSRGVCSLGACWSWSSRCLSTSVRSPHFRHSPRYLLTRAARCRAPRLHAG